MNTENIKIFIDKIVSAQTIAICGHKNPDGDSLCSALAFQQLIKLNFNKKATVIYDGNLPKDLDYVPFRQEVLHYSEIPENSLFDLFIVVDYGNKNHLGDVEKFVKTSNFIVSFDHHHHGENEIIDGTNFNDVDKASTSQLIYKFIKEASLEINKSIADLLMIAMITDTGTFKFVRYGDVLRDAADLVDCGVNLHEIIDLLQNKNKKTVLVESLTVSNAKFFMGGKLALAIIDNAAYKKLDGRGEIVLSLLGQIHGVEYVVLLKEQKNNQIGVSIRSRNIPINHIAEALGGGGHLCAAGAVIEGSLEEVQNKVLSFFKGM